MQEEHGPPLDHRLKPEMVEELAKRAGLGRVEHLKLTDMDLYRMAMEGESE